MFIKLLQKTKLIRRLICNVARIRARELVNRIQAYLKEDDRLLDVGSGTCNISEVLVRRGYEATPLDVRNLSFVDGMDPVIYDGTRMPFENEHFNKSLILTVLHHTPDPEQIILEAKRVSKSLVIIEDIYVNRFHKRVTFFFDSLMNPGYHRHPHTNKSDMEWKKTFENLGLTLVEAKYKYSFIVFKQATYYLEKRS
jgi:ubiquinone/menaquinone biosynthesis C-methylase UbiE